jgi:hypothetical protein
MNAPRYQRSSLRAARFGYVDASLATEIQKLQLPQKLQLREVA